jgi:hypothetical protein
LPSEPVVAAGTVPRSVATGADAGSKGHAPRECWIHNAPPMTAAVTTAETTGALMRRT